jgi:hypothetical protein
MNLRTKYKRYFRAACTTLLLLAFVGCAKDKLVEYGPGDATGKVVMVSLKVGIPPAVEPASTSGYSAAIPGCRLQWLWNKDKNHMR